MIIKDWKKEIFTIPNLLSFFRLILIPVYMVIYINAQQTRDYILAGSILAVSCLTDMVDGKIARKFNMITTLGKLLDPIADKATQFTLIICLAANHPVLWYLVGLFVLKETFQLVAMMINYHKGKMLHGALITGKVCTTVLFLSLIVMVLFPEMSEKATDRIAAVDAIFMSIALVDYALAYFTNRNMIPRKKPSEN